MEEKTLFKANPKMYRDNPVGFILSVILIVVGIGLLFLIIWWLATKSKTLTVTNERVMLRTGLLSKHTNEVYLSDVRNVQVYQNLFQRWTNAGKISISSAGQGNIEIEVSGIHKPEEVKKIIDDYRRPKS